MGQLQSKLSKGQQELVLASATLGYFGYVVLGAISPKLHEHVFTGDEKDSMLTRLKKGCPVTFQKGQFALRCKQSCS